ncbi:MAG: factor-independent urate hydroxylase [Janthinobacterium lividum]
MAIILGTHQYGKAENRVVRITRDTARHEIRDLNVSSALRGDFAPAHLEGNQRNVLPTDTQKNMAYAYAKTVGLETIEGYGLALARHYVDDVSPVEGARIEIEEYPWERVQVDGADHDHTFVRKGQEIRLCSVTVEGAGDAQQTWVTGGFKDLVILKSTGSEFADFYVDEFTTLAPTHDRIMATSLTAKWRFTSTDVDWDATYAGIKAIMVSTFATVHSLALQQTLFQMGKAVLEAYDVVGEVRFSAPNKHHFLYDLGQFGIDNANEVFHADDRPYGLIQAQVTRDDAPDAGPAWSAYTGLV